MADKLRYYILREAGKVMVPLVPADQLPVQLEGFPRELSHRQMSAEGWKFVTETNEQATILSSLPSQQTMSHHFPASPSKSSKFLAPDHTARTNADDIVREFISSASPLPYSISGGHHDLFGRSETETHAPARSVSAHRTFSAPTPRVFGSSDLRFAKFVQPDREFGAPSSPPIAAPKKAAQDARRSFNNTVQKHPLSLPATMASIYPQDAQRIGYKTPPPSGIEPDPTKKEFCSHWIKSGECAFMAVGCRYKHEMPPVEKLRELGFHGVPRWFKEKSAIESRGPTWMQRRMKLLKENEEDEVDMPAPRMFDPFKLRSPKQDSATRESDKKDAEDRKDGASRTEDRKARVLLPPKQIRVTSPTEEVKSPPADLLIDFEAPYTQSPPLFSTFPIADPSDSSSSPSSTPATVATPKSSPRPKQRKEADEQQHYIRRLSQISWSSDSDAAKAAKQASKRKSYPKKGVKETPAPPSTPISIEIKRFGLLQSRHASTEKEAKGVARKRQVAVTERTVKKESR